MSETSFLFSIPSFEHRELSGVETGKARKLKTKIKQDRIKAMRQETADQFLDRLLTANPRIEQNFVAKSKELHDFYVEAFEAIEPK